MDMYISVLGLYWENFKGISAPPLFSSGVNKYYNISVVWGRWQFSHYKLFMIKLVLLNHSVCHRKEIIILKRFFMKCFIKWNSRKFGLFITLNTQNMGYIDTTANSYTFGWSHIFKKTFIFLLCSIKRYYIDLPIATACVPTVFYNK